MNTQSCTKACFEGLEAGFRHLHLIQLGVRLHGADIPEEIAVAVLDRCARAATPPYHRDGEWLYNEASKVGLVCDALEGSDSHCGESCLKVRARKAGTTGGARRTPKENEDRKALVAAGVAEGASEDWLDKAQDPAWVIASHFLFNLRMPELPPPDEETVAWLKAGAEEGAIEEAAHALVHRAAAKGRVFTNVDDAMAAIRRRYE